MDIERHEVVIAGAGMAGATLALALAQAGVKVAVIDPRVPDPDPGEFDGRATAVAYAGFRIWRALGLGEQMAREAQRIETVLVADGPGPGAAAAKRLPASLRFVADDAEGRRGEGEPLAWMVENRHMRAVLNQALLASSVVVYAPAKIEALEQTAREALITLSDGRRLAAPLLIGAEGRSSAVRQMAGIGTWGWSYGQGGVVATVELERPHEATAYQYFMAGGPLAILPLTGNRASLVWSEKAGPAKALTTCSVEAFEAHLQRRFGDFLGKVTLAGAREVYPLGLQGAKSIIAPRVALVGDAAHGIHPIAGQGLNLGLKDVAALAELVIDARRVGEDWGGDAVLDRYARWRRFDTMALAAASDLFNRAFSTDEAVIRAVRGAGLRLVERLGPIPKKLFALEAGGALGDLPRLLRGEAL